MRRTFGAEERNEVKRSADTPRKTLWWDIDENVVLFSKPPGRRAYRYTMRGDFWLPGRFERRVVADVIESMYGVRYGEDRLLVFNRVGLGEYAVSVYGEGLRLGVLEYRSDTRSWILHPTGALASILESLGASVVDIGVTRQRLKGKKIRLAGHGEHVLIVSGSHAGPAVRVSDGVYKVRDMAPRGFTLLGDTSIDKLVEYNEAHLKVLEAEAIGFVRRLEPPPGERVYVAFSGGADSTATLVVAVEAFGEKRVTAVYVDTGIEFPETRVYVERIAARLGVELVVAEAGDMFWRLLPKYGPPTRDRRWCTARLKLEPLKKLYSRLKPRVILEGVRAFESTQRSLASVVSRSPVAPTARRAYPIHSWSRLEVQLYLRWKGVEPNSLYDEGLTRIGCVVCPAMHLYELWEVALRLHPSLVEAILERFVALLGWKVVASGVWRFGVGER